MLEVTRNIPSPQTHQSASNLAKAHSHLIACDRKVERAKLLVQAWSRRRTQARERYRQAALIHYDITDPAVQNTIWRTYWVEGADLARMKLLFGRPWLELKPLCSAIVTCSIHGAVQAKANPTHVPRVFCPICERNSWHLTRTSPPPPPSVGMYSEYLQSEYWQLVRKQIHQRDRVCCRCGNDEKLHVHHLTYEHVKSELDHLGDLVLLCADCHAEAHGL